MTHDQSQDSHRHQLLSILFGSDVPPDLEGQLLRTADVAALFQVSERTVSEWAKRGQIPSVRTPGGHRRYPAEGIRGLLHEDRRAARPDAQGATSAGDLNGVPNLTDRRPASA